MRYLKNRDGLMTNPDSDIDLHIVHYICRLFLLFNSKQLKVTDGTNDHAELHAAMRFVIKTYFCNLSAVVLHILYPYYVAPPSGAECSADPKVPLNIQRSNKSVMIADNGDSVCACKSGCSGCSLSTSDETLLKVTTEILHEQNVCFKFVLSVWQ